MRGWKLEWALRKAWPVGSASGPCQAKPAAPEDLEEPGAPRRLFKSGKASPLPWGCHSIPGHGSWTPLQRSAVVRLIEVIMASTAMISQTPNMHLCNSDRLSDEVPAGVFQYLVWFKYIKAFWDPVFLPLLVHLGMKYSSGELSLSLSLY